MSTASFLLFLLLLTVSSSSAFFTDGTENSYVQYPRWQACLNGSISFEFKSNDTDGLLFYTDDGGQYDFFELRLENRKLLLRFKLTKTKMGKITATSYKDLDDDRWHKVNIQRNKTWTILTVDDFKIRRQVPGTNFQFGSLERNNFVFLGGMPATYKNKKLLETLALPSIMFDERWRGQMRNLQYSNCSCPLRSAEIMKLSGARRDNLCETNNPCNKNPTCDCLINYLGKPHCDCTDKSCRPDINECDNDPCKNGGTCTNTQGSYLCRCQKGWTGIDCNQDVPVPCIPETCTFGKCTEGVDSYTCQCSPGYTGERCDVDINECDSDPCKNGGTCTNTQGSYLCRCQEGWTGNDCNQDMFGSCDSDPCYNGATCINIEGSYSCICQRGWEGNDCNTIVDHCVPNPCSFGKCWIKLDNYTCECSPGYTGRKCDVDINECLPNPCYHGTCYDRLNSYFCGCEPGYTGEMCDVDIDECLPNPCYHGTCINDVNRYFCVCAPGYIGKNCDKGPCDSTWRSRTGQTCQSYAENRFCTQNGTYGSGWWKEVYGTFENWADSEGRTALVCPECGCKVSEKRRTDGTTD